MLLLGDKYDTPEIYEEGIELLKRTFPKDFPAWDGPKPMEYAPEDVMSIANVTRNMDPDLHAVALYLCCSLPITTLISGLLPEAEKSCL
ncbi:hypothetical protein EIP86_006211 [Pleurotus ostreatoroseus]|nr:hypothetical protein EIP86_006211 [Pleurotus ostreatoroseus]